MVDKSNPRLISDHSHGEDGIVRVRAKCSQGRGVPGDKAKLVTLSLRGNVKLAYAYTLQLGAAAIASRNSLHAAVGPMSSSRLGAVAVVVRVVRD